MGAGLVTIVAWQLGISAQSAKLDNTYRNWAASGMHQDASFVYFLHYLDLFPVATTDPSPELSEAAARSYLARRPQTLMMDLGWTWFEGDRGKIYLYSLDTWLKGAPWNPSVRPFNRFAFTLALCVLFAAFWWVRRPLLGVWMVVFLGSNPFELYEVHARENVHGWTIIAAILVLAIHVPLLRYRRPARLYLLALPLVTGIVVGTIRAVRSEPALILFAAAAAYMVVTGLDRRRRAFLVATLAAAFMVTNFAWNAWFRHQEERARETLARVGGHPFPAQMRQHHALWHPIWCGLGDFGQKHGYVWDDNLAVAYAKPILEGKYREYVPANNFNSGLAPQEYWDQERLYKKLPFVVPHYDEVIRAKVLHDITTDPLWYAGVLARRAWRLSTVLTPARMQWGAHFIDLPAPGLILIPLAFVLWRTRSRFFLRLLLFTLPTCVAPFVIYSDRGMSYYAIYHLVAAAIVVTSVIENIRWWTRFGRERHA